MNFTAEEFGAINIALSTNAPDVDDRELAKEIYILIKGHINESTGHFEAGEMDLNVPQKALLLKMVPLVPWLTPQLVDFVDPLVEKLSV